MAWKKVTGMAQSNKKEKGRGGGFIPYSFYHKRGKEAAERGLLSSEEDQEKQGGREVMGKGTRKRRGGFISLRSTPLGRPTTLRGKADLRGERKAAVYK